MSDFKPGDKVLLGPRFGRAIGTVQKAGCDGSDSTVLTLSGRPFFTVGRDEMRLLPDGALELDWGSRVRINDDAPRCAGGVGSIQCGEFIAGVFGYWILLDSGNRTWVTDEALTAEAGEPR